MATLQAQIRRVLDGTFTKTGQLTTAVEKLPYTWLQSYPNGSRGDQIVVSGGTLAAASANLDLYGGLTNAFGDTVNLATVEELLIINTTTTSGYNITVSGNFLTSLIGGTTDGPIIPPGGVYCASSPVDGFTVTNTTCDTLTLDPGANTVTYQYVIIGTDA